MSVSVKFVVKLFRHNSLNLRHTSKLIKHKIYQVCTARWSLSCLSSKCVQN